MKLTIHYIKRYGVRICIICLLLTGSFQKVVAQKKTPCNRSLAAANKEYETGNFAQSIKVLSGCLNSFSKQESIEAYRLLALCELGLNNEDKAIEAAQKLLQLKHDYREFPYFDPIEFTKLLAKFEIWPRLELGLKMGFSVNAITSGKNYSVTGASQTYSTGLGYQAGFMGEYHLNKKISLNGEVLFEGLNYSMDATPISNWKQHYVEKLNYITVPLAVRYYFLKYKDIELAAEVGLQTQFLVATTSNFLFENEKSSFTYQSSAQLSDYRNHVLFYGLVGVVAKKKIGVGMFVVDLRFAVGLSKMANPDKRYDDINYVLTNQYVDSDIRFNPLYISVGYQFPIERMYVVKMNK